MTTLEHQIPVLDADNPWPGLAPFDEAQADFFYGRQREVEDLFRRVRLNLLSVLYGQSGLGKTSLVRAALFPRLRGAGLLPVPIRLDYSDGSPAARDQIWHALSSALEHAGVSVAPLAVDQTLWEYFHQRALEKTVVPVLVFDQFEELFTLGPERAGGSSFVRDCVMELAALIENRPPDRVEARFDREPKLVAQYDFDRQDYRLLVSLREDYLAHLHDLAGKVPSITLNNMRLTPLDGPRALEAVEKPGGRLVAPGAAEAIVRVVAGARDEGRERRSGGLLEAGESERGREGGQAPLESLVVDPSLLSLLCRELNQKRREDRLPAITPQLVEANRENILNNFYARCLADLPEGVQIFVEEDLLTESGFRETLTVDTAEARLHRRGSDGRALTTLVNRRLLHYEQRGAVTRVELTHDVLAPVVRQSRTLRREREAIQEAEARKRRELEENERVAQQARAEAEAKYERSRRQRRLILAFGVAMAAVAAVAVVETLQLQRASEQNAKLVTALKEGNDSLEKQQQILEAKTDTVTRARLRGDTLLGLANDALTTSAAMLNDFCTYGLRVINRFGDSTSGNPELTRAFNSLVETSDTSVDRMVERSPSTACPRQLDARILSVSVGLQLELKDTAKAIERGRLGLAATRYLLRWPDSLSRAVARRSFTDLNYNLYFAGNDTLSLEAARAVLPLTTIQGSGVGPTAYDQRARIYHYGALSWLRLQRPEIASRWLDTGLVVAEQGRRHPEQNQVGLLFTISQLYMRRREVDTLLKKPSEALAASRKAVDAARERMGLLHNVSTHTWLAQMLGWHGDLARRVGQFAEGFTAHDSSAVQWGVFLREVGLSDTANAVSALEGMVWGNIGKSAAALGLEQLQNAAVYADAAADTAASLVRLRGSLRNRHVFSQSLSWGGDVHERAGQRARADSSYRLAFRVDSLALSAAGRSSDNADQVSTGHWLDATAARIIEVQRARAQADAAGKPLEQRQRILRGAEEASRRYREAQVLAARRVALASRPGARRDADDNLASALGSVAWLYLLVDRPELAVDAAQEAMRVGPSQTFVLPNYFNALILSGRDEDAAAFFKLHASEMVEATPVLFACAALRDTRALRERGVATDRHVSVVERLSAPYLERCALPKT